MSQVEEAQATVETAEQTASEVETKASVPVKKAVKKAAPAATTTVKKAVKKTPPAPVLKKAVKKAAEPKVKASPKKTAVKDTKEQKEAKIKDVKWNPVRLTLVKTLKAMKAFDEMSAKHRNKIAEKSELTTDVVKHVLYHKEPLAKHGYVGCVQHEGPMGLSYFLTKKGAELDLKTVKV